MTPTRPNPLPVVIGRIAIGALIGISCLLCLGCVHAQRIQADAAPQQPFPNATLIRGCTQEDVPGFELYFSQAPYPVHGEPQPPFLHFEVASSPAEAFAPTTLQLDDMHNSTRKPGRIVRGRYVTSPTTSAWLSGTLVLDELVPGDHIAGRYTVTTPKGERFQNTFRLTFTPSNAVCG